MTNSNDKTRKTAVSYLRVATPKEDTMKYLSQRAAVDKKAKKLGLDLVAEFTEFADCRHRETLADHPTFMEMIGTVLELSVGYVVVYRAGVYRNYERNAQMLFTLSKVGVELVSATETLADFQAPMPINFSDYLALVGRKSERVHRRRWEHQRAA
jgi:DNA invertase Pin-like site-specific DNA recombinase